MNMVSELRTDMQTIINQIPDLSTVMHEVRTFIPDISTVIRELNALKEAMASQQARLNLLEEELARDSRNPSSENDGVGSCSVTPNVVSKHHDSSGTKRTERWLNIIMKLRRENNVLNQKVRRGAMTRHENPNTARFDNFRLSMPIDEATFVMSSRSIGKENDQFSSRMKSASSAVRTGEAINEAKEMKEIEDEETTQTKNMNRYRNVAVRRVWMQWAGPVKKRPNGGTMIAEAAIASRAHTFFTNYISIRTLAKGLANELALFATEARAELAPRKGFDTRRHVSASTTEKPVNLTGFMSRLVLTEGILASLMALDFFVRTREWVKTSKLLYLEVDGSKFNDKDMLGLVMHMVFIQGDGCDAAGHKRMKITTRSICMNSLPCADKISVDVRREDGSMFSKQVPCQMVTSLAMSGHLHDVRNHPCVYIGFDKGSETRGGGKGPIWAMRRNAFNGIGSPIRQICGTGEAIETVMSGENGPFLQKCMEFLQVPPRERFLRFQKSPDPMTLKVDPKNAVPSVPFSLRILSRKFDGEEKVYTVESDMTQHHVSRVSMTLNPLCMLPMTKGGSAEGSWCLKHAVNRAGAAYTGNSLMKATFKASMYITSELRKMHNHVHIKMHLDRVLGTKGARDPERSHLAIRQALGERLVETLRAENPRGLKRFEKGVESRWNSIQMAIHRLDEARLQLATIMPLALAVGNEDARIEAGKAVCSEEGFKDLGKFYFPSQKVGLVYFWLNDPSMILHHAVASFIHKMAFQPILAACADHSEFSSMVMSGVGSILRSIDWVLRRGTFKVFCMPKKMRELKQPRKGGNWELRGWITTPKFCHRGHIGNKALGATCISTKLEKLPEGCTSKEPPALLQLYGAHYNPKMAKAATLVKETMKAVCLMEGSRVLPIGLCSKFTAAQETYFETMTAAQWFFRYEVIRAADCIVSKTAHLLNSPQGYLAGICDVERIEVVEEGPFAFDDTVQCIDIATDKALASAKVLLLMLRELNALYPGSNLWDYVQDPLKRLIKDELPALEEFGKGKDINLRSLNLRRRPGFHEKIGYPAPVSAFPGLYELSMMANGFPRTNQRVESNWSYLTGRFHGGVRNCGPEYMSMIFRKEDFKTAGMLSALKTTEFHTVLASARQFRNQHRDDFKRVFRIGHEESYGRNECHPDTKKRDHYDTTNIAGLNHKKIAGLVKKGGSKGNSEKRTVGKLSKRHEEEGDSSDLEGNECAGSESDDPSENSSSEESSSKNDLGGSGCDQEYPMDEDAEESEHVPVVSKGGGPSTNCDRQAELRSSLHLPDRLEAPEISGVAGAQAEQDDQECDNSDISSSFSDFDDIDVPLNQLKPAANALRSGVNLSHPFPDPQSVSEKEVKSHPWKLNSIRNLIMKQEWRKTSVVHVPETQKFKGKAPILSRMDGLKFPLVKSKHHVLYVFYNDAGLELIFVEEILQNKDKAEKKNGGRGLCVRYTRVLSTAEAQKQCKSEANHKVKNTSGISQLISLGAKALQDILAKQKERKDQRTIFHRGDVPFETSAENIVGFVPWDSACDSVCGEMAEAEENSVLTKLNAEMKLDTKLKSLKEVDMVWLGSDFSDMDAE